MQKIKNINNLILLSLLFSLLFGVLLRLYNLNFDNLWFDEIVSFWVADPSLDIKENFIRNNKAEGTPFLWNFLLSIFYDLFGYETYVGRYLSTMFGILSFFSIAYLSKIIKNNNSYVLTFFLVSSNVFLIIYSQEMRVYSLVFFLCSLNLIYFFKLINSHKTKKFLILNSFLFVLFQILTILSHPFTLIIFFSFFLFSLVSFLFKKINYKYLNFSLGIIVMFILIYIPDFIINSNSYPNWVTQPGIKFYTNFYFSKFFGSRLVGLIHLIILLSLIIKFRKNFLSELNEKIVLLFIIFLSYFLPIIFGYIIAPIIWPRYIIFVIITILLILSYLIFEIQNKNIIYSLIFIIVIFTLGNKLTETNVQQFFKDRPYHKPNYSFALKEIDNSNYKDFAINLVFTEKPSHKIVFNKALGNYFNKLIEYNNLQLRFNEKIDLNNLKDNFIWIMCLQNIGGPDPGCINLNLKEKFTVLDEKYFVGFNFKLIQISK